MHRKLTSHRRRCSWIRLQLSTRIADENLDVRARRGRGGDVARIRGHVDL